MTLPLFYSQTEIFGIFFVNGECLTLTGLVETENEGRTNLEDQLLVICDPIMRCDLDICFVFSFAAIKHCYKNFFLVRIPRGQPAVVLYLATRQ